MNIFVTGTDTNIGKTVVSAWICARYGFDYFKPIQTGNLDGTDRSFVERAAVARVFLEAYSFKKPASPHIASFVEGEVIDIDSIVLPKEEGVVIEGAGGLFVPINEKFFMIDLIKKLEAPVVLVASSKLGTINHTLLSLKVLKDENISILGVVVNNQSNAPECRENIEAIEFYGKVKVVAEIPNIIDINKKNLLKIDPIVEFIFSEKGNTEQRQ